MKPADQRYTIAVDFDGVIHSYTSPWVSADVIPDPPVEGAIDWLNEIAKKFEVVLFTTRGNTDAGRKAVVAYLYDNGVRLAEGYFDVTATKPPALLYIDDRAWRFEGRFPSAAEIHAARPWNKRDWVEHGPQTTIAFEEVETRLLAQIIDGWTLEHGEELPDAQAAIVARLAQRFTDTNRAHVEAVSGLIGYDELERRAGDWLLSHPEGELPGVGSGVDEVER